MLQIGVLGVGHLGKIHLKCIQLIDVLELVGFYDPDDRNAAIATEKYGIKRFERLDDLIDAVDIVDIVTPTITHYELAKKAIEKGKHIFIEKPLTHTVQEAKELLQLVEKHPVKVQVGHVERFNPAFLVLEDMPINPMFIEVHRLATFNPRGTDVSVVLDLMIHDLDIVLSLVKSKIKSVSASGVAIVSSTPDLSNARIEFENGCVANLTASRMSLKQMRKFRLFQPKAYVSIDFLAKKTEIIRLYDQDDPQRPTDRPMMELKTDKGHQFIEINMPEIKPNNAIKSELETFAKSILNDTQPKVTIKEGYEALQLAHDILEDINKRNAMLL